ncbi:poly(A) RNA polymerase GLD2-like [Ornithodoros turicata]|uniref:poly(A) RNA polymerase GLD2-like n=1 Tax=Ornithodoros turicata TaxID=34597 RepID=UPI003138E196
MFQPVPWIGQWRMVLPNGHPQNPPGIFPPVPSFERCRSSPKTSHNVKKQVPHEVSHSSGTWDITSKSSCVVSKKNGKGLKRHLDAESTSPPQTKRRNSLPQVLSSHKEDWEKVSRDIQFYFEKNKQTKEMLRKKMKLRDTLYSIFRKSFPLCGLYIVGSSMNGTGSCKSDMDMCLMLTHYEMNQRTEATTILRHLADSLQEFDFVQQLQVIYAKVPILKIKDAVSGVEVDLNVNNTVGIRNTQLLNCYTRMNPRVAPLTLLVKAWAQHHGINEARHMTLSSYSLVLMVIHYLQCECHPPVVPCIQQMMPNKFQPNEDVRNLKLYEDLPPFVSENSMSLGELFLGFLHYYSSKFDFSQQCISVRLGATIHKNVAIKYQSIKNCPGQWKYICIEEPFDRTNTARAVYDPSAFELIQSTFNRSASLLQATRSLQSVLPL